MNSIIDAKYTLNLNGKFASLNIENGVEKFFLVLAVKHKYQTDLNIAQLYKKYNCDLVLFADEKYFILNLIKDAIVID